MTATHKRFSHMTEQEWAEHDARLRAEREAVDREQDRKARVADGVRAAGTGVPTRFLSLLAASVRETEAMVEVRRNGFSVLVLAGAVGRGKTVAACWWLLGGGWPPKDPLEPAGRRDPLFVSSARLSRWERYDNREMDRLLQASRLVIDDLGEEFSDTKGNFLAVLDETISDRVANERPTVITTNLDVEKFRERYGKRITDRIKGDGRWVAFAGESMRGEAATVKA